MQQYLRKAPARRLTYGKSAVFKLWLAALVVMGLMAYTQAAYAHLHDHGQRRGQRHDHPQRCGVGEFWEQPAVRHHTRCGLPRGFHPGGRGPGGDFEQLYLHQCHR